MTTEEERAAVDKIIDDMAATVPEFYRCDVEAALEQKGVPTRLLGSRLQKAVRELRIVRLNHEHVGPGYPMMYGQYTP